MADIEIFVKQAADLLWGDWLLCALLGLGLVYTVMTGCIQLRFLCYIRRGLFQRPSQKDSAAKKGCTSV